jgi:transcription elongation factor Elf1
MDFLVFTCPEKGREFSSHIRTDEQTIAAIEKASVTLHCPVCGGVHRMTVRHGRLAGAGQSAAA